ncbi:MAG: hypothetical protein WC868_10280, partial [Bacteroidales bacterium]
TTISAVTDNFNAATSSVYGFNNYSTAAVNKVFAINGDLTNDPANDGNGYAETSNNSAAVKGYNYNGAIYTFGVAGWNYNDDNRCGGTFGANQGGTYWGALGYKLSGGTTAGVYGTNATWAGGTGFLSSSNIQGVGGAFYGGVIGGWTRGDVMGHISAGEMFASYNLGNAYTSGYSAEVVTLKDKRVAAYSVTSTDIKVYSDGTSKLTNGKARVSFERAFTELIGDNKPVVTTTPMGQCNGIYISNVDSKGFDVSEINNGNSNVEFSYILIGKRIDADNKPELPEALSGKDFDEKMKGVMFNENNLEQSATPIWWDGTKVRFDNQPEPKAEIKKESDMQKEMQKAALPVEKNSAVALPSEKMEKIEKVREQKDRKPIEEERQKK